MRTGTGELVPPNAIVYIFYKAYLQNEEYPFISSQMLSTAPRRYQLGSGALCAGYSKFGFIGNCVYIMRVPILV